MLHLLPDTMILANNQRRWYIPYGDDKQDFYAEKSIVGDLAEGKLGLVYGQTSRI